jgi:uncharacterized protein with GYD domain
MQFLPVSGDKCTHRPDLRARHAPVGKIGWNDARAAPYGRSEMPTYVMLTNLTSDGVKTLKSNPGRVQEVNKEVEALGAKVIDQWATLGRFDFITVVEAPDPETMAKVSVELGSRGTMTSETLVAVPTDELVKAI